MTNEVGDVNGVTNVDVDLATGRVTVTGDGYSDNQIHAAVDEAGYHIVSAPA